MAFLTWDPLLRTGHDNIDMQHMRLFLLANELEAFGKGSRRRQTDERREEEVVQNAVYRLGEYVIEHFPEEEALMDEYGYPGLSGHHELHRLQTQESMQLAMHLVNGDDMSADFLAQVVQGWIGRHELVEDVRVAQYVRTHVAVKAVVRV